MPRIDAWDARSLPMDGNAVRLNRRQAKVNRAAKRLQQFHGALLRGEVGRDETTVRKGERPHIELPGTIYDHTLYLDVDENKRDWTGGFEIAKHVYSRDGSSREVGQVQVDDEGEIAVAKMVEFPLDQDPALTYLPVDEALRDYVNFGRRLSLTGDRGQFPQEPLNKLVTAASLVAQIIHTPPNL